MRTTHTGGVASTSSEQEEIYANIEGIIDLSTIQFAINKQKESIVLTSGYLLVKNDHGKILDKILINHGFYLTKSHGDFVTSNEIIAFINKSVHKIIAMYEGIIKFNNIIPGITVKEIYDESMGIYRRKIISSIQYSDNVIHPSIIIYNAKTNKEFYYYLDEGYLLGIQENDVINIGDIIASKYFKSISAQDITGGLPKVIDIFESKIHLNSAIIASHDGIVKILRHKKNKYIFIHDAKTDKVLNRIIVGNNRNIIFQDNMLITKGVTLVDGKINIQDLLDIMGYNFTIKYIIGSISIIYEDQGVNINYKHIETIAKQMLKYGLITKTNDIKYPLGKIMEYKYLLKNSINGNFEFRRIVLGITKVSLSHYPSFISSSSFQHTIPAIALAALENATDYLKGIKENVIFNKAIPVGTSFKDFIIK
jgi:DNA-directed RNA polymerase subunit beta'